MGANQSQVIENFINNYVSTNVVSEVISKYASETNAISDNVQDVAIQLTGSTSGPLNLKQKIESVIDVEQMISRMDKVEVVNDLQRVISNTMKDAIMSSTDGLADIFASPSNQAIRDKVLNNINTYVSNVINTSTIDNLLLRSSNYQKGNLVIDSSTINGPIEWSQEIQSNIMGQNLIEKVTESMLQNKDVTQLTNVVETKEESKRETPISAAIADGLKGILGGLKYMWIIILAVIVFIVGILIAVFVPATPKVKIIIGVVAVVIAIALAITFFVVSRKK